LGLYVPAKLWYDSTTKLAIRRPDRERRHSIMLGWNPALRASTESANKGILGVGERTIDKLRHRT
jgi:hypothetical protein